ncbi:hypothetical protein FJ973_29710 [Mesorhizobium sp. B2-1-3]|uniref:hypothetical protein n=1 Tax=Mesorhizobium sp. B2-1-3 TaxID=2589972 RepID=UPI001126C3D3|nr:hypothetical protein [Mesorhizobium sp. B2-1-3]TPN03821.1 hypothetical protein FJ973_29710 [Mesorhizobium sp. B2-1-3]
MTTIPDDIRATARRIAKEAIYNGGVDWAADDFAEALMQERERCASIADDIAQKWDIGSDRSHEFEACCQIAAAIRSPDSAEKP